MCSQQAGDISAVFSNSRGRTTMRSLSQLGQIASNTGCRCEATEELYASCGVRRPFVRSQRSTVFVSSANGTNIRQDKEHPGQSSTDSKPHVYGKFFWR